MLDEYILNQLDKLEVERETLTAQLQKLVQEEAEEEQKIQELLEQENVGIELFSPRAAQNSVKIQIERIRKHIDDLQYEQARVQDLLEKNKDSDEKYQLLLLESREKTNTEVPAETAGTGTSVSAAEVTRSSLQNIDTEALDCLKKETKEELETILIRVERCLNLIHTDKVKCKNELKNLRYYLKALLSKDR